MAHALRSEQDFRALSESASICVTLAPDPPRYTVLAVSEAYARVMLARPEDIVGRALSEVFPRNPEDPGAPNVTRAIYGSLERVIRSRRTERSSAVRYDVLRRTGPHAGTFEERWWRLETTPLLAADGRILFLNQRLENLTELVRLEEDGARASKRRAPPEGIAELREALGVSERRCHQLIEDAPDAVFVADLSGNYVDVNKAACNLLGYSREELLTMKIAELLRPEQVPRLASEKQELMRGEPRITEWELRKKDGSFVPIEINGKLLPNGHVQAFARDLTDRKQMERALRLSEEKFSGIIAISADAIFSVDEALRIILFNEGAEKIFGYPMGEAMGMALEQLFPTRYRDLYRRQIEAFRRGDARAGRLDARGEPIMALRKDGEEFPGDVSISKLSVGGDQVLTFDLRDITALKRAENEHRLLSEVGAILTSTLEYETTLSRVANLLVRQLADLCLVGVSKDRDHLAWIRVTSRDPALQWACDALAASPYLLRPKSRVTAALREDRSSLLQNVCEEEIIDTAQSEEHSRALRALKPRSIIIVPLPGHAEPVGVLILANTEGSRRWRSQDLQLAEALSIRAGLSIENAQLYRSAERAIRLRDNVLRMVAHDLRNPLNAILLQTSIMERKAQASRQNLKGSVEPIRRAALRMSRMIHDLLDVAKLQSGHLRLERTRVSAEEIARASVDALQPLLKEKELSLRSMTLPRPPELWADRDRLLQVLENLIGNAIKFTAPGGTITVTQTLVAGELVFKVSDTGIGISPEDLGHVFEPFWQAPERGRKGAGLGLAIVKGLVEAHGGRVSVKSAPGQGSTFCFTIPVVPIIQRDARARASVQ